VLKWLRDVFVDRDAWNLVLLFLSVYVSICACAGWDQIGRSNLAMIS
jgi:hypothetical protein